MTIHIEALTLDVIIGLLDFERDRPQQVIVDLEASYHYDKSNFMNYAEMAEQIETCLKEGRFELLEDALLSIKTALHTAYPQMETLQIKIAKPDILPRCSVALSQAWTFSPHKI